MRVLLLILIAGLTACSTTSQHEVAEREVYGDVMSNSDYKGVVFENSRKASGYAGLDNVFNYEATLLNKRVLEGQARRQSSFYQWTPKTLRQHIEKDLQELSSGTRVFLSFFTPVSKHDDLNNSQSIWKVYLEVNGMRYSGKVKKISDPVAKTQALFPYHNVWSSAYVVTFLVPNSEVESSDARFIITGSLGSGEAVFR